MAKFIKLTKWGGDHAVYHNTDNILRFWAPGYLTHYRDAAGRKSEMKIGAHVFFRIEDVSNVEDVDQTPEEILALLSLATPPHAVDEMED